MNVAGQRLWIWWISTNLLRAGIEIRSSTTVLICTTHTTHTTHGYIWSYIIFVIYSLNWICLHTKMCKSQKIIFFLTNMDNFHQNVKKSQKCTWFAHNMNFSQHVIILIHKHYWWCLWQISGGYKLYIIHCDVCMLGYLGAAILSNIGKVLKGGVGAVVLLISTVESTMALACVALQAINKHYMKVKDK